MHRILKDLDNLQQAFIDTVYIQLKTFPEAAKILEVEIATIRQLNKDLEPHWRSITKIRNKWKSKKVGGNFWDFCYWYKTTEPCCHYCGISQAELDQLHVLGLVNKRTTRGKTLEIERKAANESYSNISNLTYSCYWCNNAKTDTFTDEEFKTVGEAIGTIWKQRLKK
jgi:hypothetical protein